MGLDFTLVDVFTDRPFGGNQLAVFTDADGIDERTMQQLAREFNFSETTFVLPPRDPANTCRVRIFTPAEELPFAGHPTIGTAAVLAGARGGEVSFVFEEGIGPVGITADGPMIRLHLREPAYESPAEAPSAPVIARALALPEEAVTETWFAGIGVRFCFVRLADKELVDEAEPVRAVWKTELTDAWGTILYVVAGDDDTELYARSFAPDVGVEEDPATGSACAALIASLAQRSGRDGEHRVRVDQGVAMGRPSVLHGTATREAGRLTEVTVGGQATIIGHGTML
jgi:trans-2,3-dihydro-3-hydroxyanthranilate isomerase